ncbi:MAG: hypothetical protein BWX92_03032 [Deltaproteobacteria bacterium ADurb.Bin135]|nr:MAG: hypothetical protein BWX92_03032 [Deltaproteobacteria bacterium ADurb.Bin135]
MNTIEIAITQGNIDNYHLSVRGYKQFFPHEVFGGSNKRQEGATISLHVLGIPEVIKTDIAGDKGILRGRAWCKKFYSIHSLQEGDIVVIDKHDDFNYSVYPKDKSKQ